MDSPAGERVTLITGATSGIGRVAARELARRGGRIVVVGRSPQKCDRTVQHIRAASGNASVDALVADLSSMQEIRQLAERFQADYSRLDVLINNAGGIWMKRQLSVDGFEMTFAVNHLAYFLLTLLLLDRLQASRSGRVVNVASRAHRRARLDFADLMGERSYGGWTAYGRSKLANLLFTYELARRLRGTAVTVNALHPGWVATGFASNNGWPGRLISLAADLFARTPEQGAQTLIHLASSPEVAKTSGRYFVDNREAPSSAASHDEAAARQLWQVSLQLCNLPDRPQSANAQGE